MEDFKDVMLAEPPARFASAPAYGGGGNGNPTSMESYKGILLCGRPNDGGRARDQNAYGGSTAPFLPAGKSDDARNAGLQPSVEERARLDMQKQARMQSTAVSNSQAKKAVLSKHRAWLVSFAKAVKDMKEEEENRGLALQEQRDRLREKLATERRSRIDGTATLNDAQPNDTSSTSAAVMAAAPSKKGFTTTSTRGKGTATQQKAKPKWAMTEDEADDAEFAQARELIDFAASLDFHKYMQDYEVREAMAIMRDRVKEIAATEGLDLEAAKKAAAEEDDEDDTASIATDAQPPSDLTGEAKESWVKSHAERREKRRARQAARANAAAPGDLSQKEAGWDRSVSDRVKKAVSSEALRLADKVLATSDAIRKIHSRQSLAKLLQDASLAEEKRSQGELEDYGMNAQDNLALALSKERIAKLPKVAVYASEALKDPTFAGGVTTGSGSGPAPEQRRVLTDLRKATDRAQNLPYLYRCPSI